MCRPPNAWYTVVSDGYAKRLTAQLKTDFGRTGGGGQESGGQYGGGGRPAKGVL
ncbi:hypothetical protein [Streptomyces sp. NPDC002990]